MKKIDIGTTENHVSNPEKQWDGWYLTAMFGPFKTKEEAAQFRLHIAGFEPPKPLTPPTLGISVSETIATKDKFGG